MVGLEGTVVVGMGEVEGMAEGMGVVHGTEEMVGRDTTGNESLKHTPLTCGDDCNSICWSSICSMSSRDMEGNAALLLKEERGCMAACWAARYAASSRVASTRTVAVVGGQGAVCVCNTCG